MVNSLVPKPDSSDLSNEDVSPLDHIQATVCKEEQLFLSHTHPPAPPAICVFHFPLHTWNWIGATQHPKCQKCLSVALRVELLKVLQCQRKYINPSILLNQHKGKRA